MRVVSKMCLGSEASTLTPPKPKPAGGSRTIATVMTADPVVLRHDETIAIAINKMAVGGFRHVPIVRGGVPVGVVSARDVFRHLAAGLD